MPSSAEGILARLVGRAGDGDFQSRRRQGRLPIPAAPSRRHRQGLAAVACFPDRPGNSYDPLDRPVTSQARKPPGNTYFSPTRGWSQAGQNYRAGGGLAFTSPRKPGNMAVVRRSCVGRVAGSAAGRNPFPASMVGTAEDASVLRDVFPIEVVASHPACRPVSKNRGFFASDQRQPRRPIPGGSGFASNAGLAHTPIPGYTLIVHDDQRKSGGRRNGRRRMVALAKKDIGPCPVNKGSRSVQRATGEERAGILPRRNSHELRKDGA